MENLDPEILHFILKVSLTREELLQRVQGFGITFAGVRPSQLNPTELADALVETFYKDPSDASEISLALDAKLSAPMMPPIQSRQDFKRTRSPYGIYGRKKSRPAYGGFQRPKERKTRGRFEP